MLGRGTPGQGVYGAVPTRFSGPREKWYLREMSHRCDTFPLCLGVARSTDVIRTAMHAASAKCTIDGFFEREIPAQSEADAVNPSARWRVAVASQRRRVIATATTFACGEPEQSEPNR